jgi:hypothetical protein
VRHFAQAATAQTEISVKAARPSTNTATIMQANGWIFAFSGSHPAFAFLIDHRSLGHDFSSNSAGYREDSASLALLIN